MKQYSAYSKYKPTGIEWLGDVPKHWVVDRLKWSTAGLVNGVWGEEPNGVDDIICVRVADFNRSMLTLVDFPETLRAVDAKERGPRLLRKGDLLIEKSGGGEKQLVGCVVYFNLDITAVSSNFVARIISGQDMQPRFWCYVHATLYAARLNYCAIKQTTGIQNLDSNSYLDILVAFPPEAEQTAIADFLDRKTTEIDTLVAKKRSLIEKLKEKRSALISRTVTRGLPPEAARAAGLEPNLKMKPSGVEWLGDIPTHWETVALRFLFRNLDHRRIPVAGEDRATMEKIYPYYGASGIIDSVEEYLFDETLILVAEDGANLLSRSTPLAFLATDKYWVNNHAHILKPLNGDIRYWVGVLQTFDYTPLVTGAAQPKLTSERLGSIKLPKPPATEQLAIADFLDRETVKIDSLAAKIEQAIERLQEYRTALITAAVTGKIDVRHSEKAAGIYA